MLISMRTTLVLEDALVRAAKKRAASQGTTLSDVMNHALRAFLAPTGIAPPTFEMVVFGDPEAAVHHEPRDFFDALESDETPRG
jgi:putative antitoxin of VapBC-like toxin-antitoxin system